MANAEWNGEGLAELLDQIKKAAGLTDTQVLDCMETAAEALSDDARRLPRPVSRGHNGGYTHLVRTISFKRDRTRNEIAVGWGKYYGRFVEYGTRKMAARAHLRPLWNGSREKYFSLVQKEFEKTTGLSL